MKALSYSWLSPARRQIIARIFLFFGGFAPGIALLVSPSTWGSSPTFQQLSQLPVPLQLGGVFLIVASLMIFKKSWRDLGYTLIAMYYTVLNISAGFAVYNSLINHIGNLSALIFALPVLLWVYLEAAITASRDEADIPTQFSGPPIREE